MTYIKTITWSQSELYELLCWRFVFCVLLTQWDLGVSCMMAFLSQVFLVCFGHCKNTNSAKGTVSNTHPYTLYTASAVLMCNTDRNHLKSYSEKLVSLCWYTVTHYLHCEIFEGYLFSQIIRVKRPYISSSFMTWVASNGVKGGGWQLARVSVYSSARWTSCCCASYCRAALRQRLSETGGRRRKAELLEKVHQSRQSILVWSCIISKNMTWITCESDSEITDFLWKKQKKCLSVVSLTNGRHWNW